MEYTQTNYGTVSPKQIQENKIELDEQWDPTTPIAVLFTRIEDFKLFSEDGEGPFNKKNILCSAYLATIFFNLTCDTWQENPRTNKNTKNLEYIRVICHIFCSYFYHTDCTHNGYNFNPNDESRKCSACTPRGLYMVDQVPLPIIIGLDNTWYAWGNNFPVCMSQTVSGTEKLF